MSIDMYNDDDLISGENVFKKAFKGLRAGIKKAYGNGSSISIDKNGVNVIDKPQIIVDKNADKKGGFVDGMIDGITNRVGKEVLVNSLLVGVGLIALLVITGKKRK